jgi:PIN domain nuclease of toxin-antitoxin system
MRVLLDTSALLWSLAGAKRIEPVRELLLDESTDVFISAVSWWEIAIKIRIGKLAADLDELIAAATRSGFAELPLNSAHARTLAALPRHHNDPFDHMLIAQAITEPMRFITGDMLLQAYSPLVLLI